MKLPGGTWLGFVVTAAWLALGPILILRERPDLVPQPEVTRGCGYPVSGLPPLPSTPCEEYTIVDDWSGMTWTGFVFVSAVRLALPALLWGGAWMLRRLNARQTPRLTSPGPRLSDAGGFLS